MATFSFVEPKLLSGASYFGSRGPVLLNRLRTLLILSGHGSIIINGKNVRLKDDFLSAPSMPSSPLKIGTLVSKIPACTNSEFRALLSNAATKNIAIHTNIFNESLHCVGHYRSKSYLASFVHLYRLIEHAALYLPLVTIITKGINNLTFVQYQEVIDNKAKADLSVLRKFSEKILDNNFSDTVARYSFAGTSNPQQNATIIKSLLKSEYISRSGSDFVEIKYKHTDTLVVAFRNQFFHYLYHERNISLMDLSDPDEFLAVCLPHFLTYFSFLFRELLIAEWEIWA